jgi:hypothetical protein
MPMRHEERIHVGIRSLRLLDPRALHRRADRVWFDAVTEDGVDQEPLSFDIDEYAGVGDVIGVGLGYRPPRRRRLVLTHHGLRSRSCPVRRHRNGQHRHQQQDWTPVRDGHARILTPARQPGGSKGTEWRRVPE